MNICEAYYRYVNSCDTLYDCYKQPSLQKKAIWREILNESIEDNGDFVAIISHNIHIFTCGYTFKDEVGIKYFKYFTPSRIMIVRVSDIMDKFHKVVSVLNT